MSNSSQKVIAYIKQAGYEEAEKFFGRTKASLKQWENNPDRVPAWAADKLAGEAPQPEIATATPVASGDVMGRLASLEGRVASLEFKTQPSTMTAVVPPQKQPNWTDPHTFRK